MKRQKLETLLSERGCEIIRGQGRHTIWKNLSGASPSVPRHQEIKKFTARAICKRLGIDPQKVTN